MKTALLPLCGALAAVLSFSTVALALDDTPENRSKEADRYLEVAAPRDMLEEMTSQLAITVPDAEKQKFKDALTKNFDYPGFLKSMKEVMVRQFTATELAALADFYSSDVGKSAMKKVNGFMSEIMPLMQTEILKAQQKAFNQQGGLTAMPPGVPAKDGATATPAATPSGIPTPPPAAPGTTTATASPTGTPASTVGGTAANAGAAATATPPTQPGQTTQPPTQPQGQGPQPATLPFPAGAPPIGGIPFGGGTPDVIPATKG